MKILQVHNTYLIPGGEDTVAQAEASLLRSMGHTVQTFTRSNHEILQMGWSQGRLAWECLWSQRSYQSMRQCLREFRPDVVHFHNFFPLITPSAYFACQQEGSPVVQTLHNYRLLCPVATLFRDGKVCEECIQQTLGQSVLHRCYHRSAFQTAVVALMIKMHRMLGTWAHKVDAYITLTEFGQQKFIANGLPAEKLHIKGNFLPSLSGKGLPIVKRSGAVFVGRLEREKGVLTLVSAWRKIKTPLTIIGTGSLHGELQRLVEDYRLNNVHLAGQLTREEVMQHFQEANFIVVPSEWYEGFPMVIAEAFASGLPVISSRIGGLPELVKDGETGLLFQPGDATDLALTVEQMVNHPDEASSMAGRGLELCASRCSAATNYSQLMAIYASAIEKPAMKTQKNRAGR